MRDLPLDELDVLLRRTDLVSAPIVVMGPSSEIGASDCERSKLASVGLPAQYRLRPARIGQSLLRLGVVTVGITAARTCKSHHEEGFRYGW